MKLNKIIGLLILAIIVISTMSLVVEKKGDGGTGKPNFASLNRCGDGGTGKPSLA